jgi:succinyl-CoA synthetase beta subunit
VIRLAGTNENEGNTLIKEYITKTSKNNIILVETMEEGAKKAIELSSDNYGHHC